MVGDAKLLFQVFSNLLSNAVKYSPGGGAIEVEAGIAANEVVVAVADRGIGIPADDLDRLFERYHRGSNVSGIVGTGVGLYLVKMAVDLHHGRVEVDKSRRPRAPVSCIRLPLKAAPSLRDQKLPAIGSRAAHHRVEAPPIRGALRKASGMKAFAFAMLALSCGRFPSVRPLRQLTCPPTRRSSERIGRDRNPCRGGSATIAPSTPSAGRPYCSDHCGFDYQFYFCSRDSFGCCRIGFGYCDWNGLLRCHP